MKSIKTTLFMGIAMFSLFSVSFDAISQDSTSTERYIECSRNDSRKSIKQKTDVRVMYQDSGIVKEVKGKLYCMNDLSFLITRKIKEKHKSSGQWTGYFKNDTTLINLSDVIMIQKTDPFDAGYGFIGAGVATGLFSSLVTIVVTLDATLALTVGSCVALPFILAGTTIILNNSQTLSTTRGWAFAVKERHKR